MHWHRVNHKKYAEIVNKIGKNNISISTNTILHTQITNFHMNPLWTTIKLRLKNKFLNKSVPLRCITGGSMDLSPKRHTGCIFEREWIFMTLLCLCTLSRFYSIVFSFLSFDWLATKYGKVIFKVIDFFKHKS